MKHVIALVNIGVMIAVLADSNVYPYVISLLVSLNCILTILYAELHKHD